jgi:uncharacterized protein YndB with AHSA1/START domain
VTIIDPEDGSAFPSGALVTFTATATDDQDNDVSDTIKWFFDLIARARQHMRHGS